MPTKKTLILTAKQIEQKVNRIAYQIYESNANEKSIVIAGIMPNGFVLAQRIAKSLEAISPIKTNLIEINLDKNNPYTENENPAIQKNNYTNSVVVLVDDVLNSGKTMIYGVKHFLHAPIKRLNTAVLIDRNHSTYPVKADFVGLSLSTTMQEHIEVDMKKKGSETVYLL